MNVFRNFIEILFKPGWKLFVEGILAILSAIVFFRPDWQPFLSWPAISKFLNWYWLIILVLLVLWLATAWEAAKKISEIEKAKQKSLNQFSPTLGNQTSGGHSVVSGRDTIIHPPAELLPPNIVLGSYDENNLLSQKKTFYLKPLSTKPDIGNLVDKKREELLKNAATPRDTSQMVLDKSVSSMLIKQMHSAIAGYPDRVEKYLVKYRTYQNDLYVISILGDRYKRVKIILEVRDERPASNITVKLFIPNEFPFPYKYVEKLSSMKNFWQSNNLGENYEIEPPEEPNIYLLSQPQSIGAFVQSDYYSSRSEKIITGDLEVATEHGKKVVIYEFGNVLQNLPNKDFPAIPVWLGDIQQTTKWNLDYEIYANELPRPIKGSIEIVAVLEE